MPARSRDSPSRGRRVGCPARPRPHPAGRLARHGAGDLAARPRREPEVAAGRDQARRPSRLSRPSRVEADDTAPQSATLIVTNRLGASSGKRDGARDSAYATGPRCFPSRLVKDSCNVQNDGVTLPRRPQSGPGTRARGANYVERATTRQNHRPSRRRPCSATSRRRRAAAAGLDRHVTIPIRTTRRASRPPASPTGSDDDDNLRRLRRTRRGGSVRRLAASSRRPRRIR